MLSDCSTNSSWLHGLWKKAASQVSFQMRECAWRCLSASSRSTTVTPGSVRSRAATSGRAACAAPRTQSAPARRLAASRRGATSRATPPERARPRAWPSTNR